MKPGMYRNSVGAVLYVTGSWLPQVTGERMNTLGGIYRAEARDDLFGTIHYLVTPSSMKGCGYELIEREVQR